MKLNRKWLMQAMKTASTAVNRRSPKPILQKLLLTRADGAIGIHGTDTELSVSVFQEAGHSVPERLLLPMEVLSFIDMSDAEDVTVSDDVGKVTILCNRSEVTFNTEDPAEFPVARLEPSENVTKVDGKLLQRAIKRVMYAADEDSNRFALGSVLLSDTPSGLLCVATDGRRLSKATVDAVAVGGLDDKCQWLLPIHSAKAICSMPIDEAWIWGDSSSIYFADATTRFSTRMVEGRFPNWKQVVPADDGLSVARLAKDPLVRLLKQASIVVNNETRGIDLSFSEGSLSAKAAMVDRGASSVQMPIEYEGEPVTVKLDYRYLLDFIEQAEDVVEIKVKASNAPVKLAGGAGYEGVLMPMALT
jgi:DNA polymerase-3 subunit beta